MATTKVTTGGITDATIATADIADQAVALSKLPHGDGSSDGKFLRANNGADPTFETVSIPAGTTINNNADNRVITGSGTANTLNGEANLTYDGNSFISTQTTSSSDCKFILRNSNTPASGSMRLEFHHGTGSTEGTNRFRYGFIEGIRQDSSNAGALGFGTKPDNASAPAEKMRLDKNGNLLHGVTASENTTSNSGPKLITAGDIQIDGDQKALVFRSTGSSVQLQSGIQWWNENGAGVQAKIHCDRTHTTLAKSDLVFYTNANVDTSANNSEGDITEQMRISSAGYVTKPNHPAFRAGRQTTDQNVGSGDAIIFNQAGGSYKHFNTGGHYNAGNGRFTAPVAGVYHFYALIIWEGISNNTNMTDSFDMYINNSQAAYSSRRAYYRNEYTGNGEYFTDFITMTIKLAANDYVWCRNKYASKVIHNNDTYTTFQGHLVG